MTDTAAVPATAPPAARRPVVLVTGASRGIGESIARAFAAQNYTVVAVARDVSALTQIGTAAPNIVPLPLDVTDTDALPAAVAEIEATHGPIEVLVNNAGYGLRAAIEDAPIAEVRR